MKNSAKRRLGLISTIMLSLTAVASASVSTFAWFQAQANVTINTQSSSTTITVNKPDEYVFYGYNGNINSSFSPNGTFTNDFTALTTPALVTQYTNLEDMSPGDVYFFALGVNKATSVSLVLNEIISNNATKQNILDSNRSLQERYVYNTDNYTLNIGYAIDIFVMSEMPANNNSPTDYASFLSSPSGTDKFDFSIANANDRSDLSTGSYASQEITLSSTNKRDIEFFNDSNLLSSNDLYIFWAVVYSNASSLLYSEVTNAGVSLKEEPLTGNRYFTQDNDNGTSNCYGGLTFALTEFTLTIA